MRIVPVLLIAVFIGLGSGAAPAAVASASAPAEAGQPPDPPEPVAIVENFLLARSLSDFPGATGWCASLLELQDSDGSWFVDAPTTSEWLRQLTSTYVVDTLARPVADGNTVTWTERLARRAIPFPEALRSSISVDVHAVVRDGKIAYLSGPYPPIPLRRPGSAISGGPVLREASSSRPAIPPFTLFVGSALGLLVTLLLANPIGSAVCGAARRRRR